MTGIIVSLRRQPAVFLDRDGTLIEDRGYLSRPEEVAFFPETFLALRKLQRRFLLFIVTNQGGIGEGLISDDAVAGVNQHIVSELAAAGVRIAEVYVCPHRRNEGCRCIKPYPHFLLQAAERHAVDLTSSFTIGDHPYDIELARRAGARAGIYVLTGHGLKHRDELPPATPVAATIGQAAKIIEGYVAD